VSKQPAHFEGFSKRAKIMLKLVVMRLGGRYQEKRPPTSKLMLGILQNQILFPYIVGS